MTVWPLSVAIVTVLPEIDLTVPSWLTAAGAAVAGVAVCATRSLAPVRHETIPKLNTIFKASELFRITISILIN